MIQTFYVVELTSYLSDRDYTKLHEPLLSKRDEAHNWSGPWKLVCTSVVLQGFDKLLYSTWSREYKL